MRCIWVEIFVIFARLKSWLLTWIRMLGFRKRKDWASLPLPMQIFGNQMRAIEIYAFPRIADFIEVRTEQVLTYGPPGRNKSRRSIPLFPLPVQEMLDDHLRPHLGRQFPATEITIRLE